MIDKQDYKDTHSVFRYLMIFISIAILFFCVWTFFLKAPQKIITNYEWFHQQNASHGTYVNSIRQAKDAINKETDKQERQRLSVELTGLKNLCYNGVNAYNARAMQHTTGWAQDARLPNRLNLTECDQ